MQEENQQYITIQRKIDQLEQHIISLIVNIQGILPALDSLNVKDLKQVAEQLSQPLKLNDTAISHRLREVVDNLKKVTKENQKLDLAQTLSEIKYIGNRLKSIEERIAEIENNHKEVKVRVVIDEEERHNKLNQTPVEQMLATLTQIEREIVVHRAGLFGNKRKTYAMIAEMVDLTPSEVSFYFKKAISYLKKTERVRFRGMIPKETREKLGLGLESYKMD